MNSTNEDGGVAAGEQDIARELMTAYLVDHYKRVHEIVQAKLGHARTATGQGLAGADAKTDAAEQLQKLDIVWQEIIALFRQSGLTTKDMEAIEKVLESIPATIKAHYTQLVDDDAGLCRLMAEIADEEYRNAYEQSRGLAKRLGVKTDFTLDENDRPVPAENSRAEVKKTIERALIFFPKRR